MRIENREVYITPNGKAFADIEDAYLTTCDYIFDFYPSVRCGRNFYKELKTILGTEKTRDVIDLLTEKMGY